MIFLDRRRFLKWSSAAAAGVGVSVLGFDGLLEPLKVTQESPAPPASNVGVSNSFTTTGSSLHGNWSVDVQYDPLSWTPGARINLATTLHLSNELMSTIKGTGLKIDGLCVLVTAERDFDSIGFQRSPWNEQFSTLLTATGLPIEGGGSSAVSRFSGHTYRTPVDVLLQAPLTEFKEIDDSPGGYLGSIAGSSNLPQDLPPGIYRLRLDFGFKSRNQLLNFNGDGIGARPQDLSQVSCAFSPPIAASGIDAYGRQVDGSQILRRCHWVLLADYNSNGYRGVIAEEAKGQLAISPRNIIHDEIILPRFDVNGRPVSYSLEPTFLMDTINPQRNIPWQYSSGEWSVKVTSPDGTTTNLGTSNFVDKRGYGATTKNPKLTAWKPPTYGRYTVLATGWIEDIWGNRYEGGGTYSFWIANRMTMATATFQGQPYNVENRYGRDMAFIPPLPADVTVKADLYVNSDPNNVRSVTSTGTATPGGIFTAAQGLKTLTLDAPGEYHSRITATCWDADGNLWVCAMRHAGVVYPADSPIIAHGKKLYLLGKYVDRGEQHLEGYVSEPGDTRHLDHITFPYNSGDAILIASEQQGANKIEPVLLYETKGENKPYDPTFQPVGKSNVQIKTSNGLSPEMFPEYITDLAYFYGAAPRPGFMSRFIVAHDVSRAPYWPTSRTNFGGQIGASNNGDMPGTIYRLLGGVVLKPKSANPIYAGYQASAFILPKGTNNNRIIGPGDEDLPSPDGTPARFYLVPVRPGMVYQVGTLFGAVLQIDPIVPCTVKFTLTAPDGSQRVALGNGDQFGYFAATDKWTLDQPGVWYYSVEANWNGNLGRVPGLPETGGYIFVIENQDAPGPGMTLTMPDVQSFSPTDGLQVRGRSTASEVYFAAITPGSVLEQGVLQVSNSQFNYKFDPKKLANKIQAYDIVNLASGKPEIGRVVHLTFFAKEVGSSGSYHSFGRVILRGTTAIYVKTK